MLSELAYRSFRVYFNHRKEWFDVFLYDVDPKTFQRKDGGRWAYFVRADGENEIVSRNRFGKFGEIHAIDTHTRQLRLDTVSHELFHLLAEWMRIKNVYITLKNEETLASRLDELTRNFWSEYHKQ